jgi:hypothetical protein
MKPGVSNCERSWFLFDFFKLWHSSFQPGVPGEPFGYFSLTSNTSSLLQNSRGPYVGVLKHLSVFAHDVFIIAHFVQNVQGTF